MRRPSDIEIPLSRPDITDADIESVVKTLRSGRLSIGPMQREFESLVSTCAGCRYGVAVSSGTCGLHLILRSLNIGPGDEVVTTPFSFIASSNAIPYTGAKPVFADIDPVSLNMDPAKVDEKVTERTKAILAVEAFGNPMHMDSYAAIAARHEIPLIEDSCEALGSTHKGRRAGSFGRAGVFAFYPNKQITTGEGGMIVTDDERLADACRSLRNQGRAPDGGSDIGSWLEHAALGYNYRLDEMSAALGVTQMQRLRFIIERRQTIAKSYMSRLMEYPYLILPTIHADTAMSWFVFVVRLSTDYSEIDRDAIIDGLRRHEVGSSVYFPCIHLQPLYRKKFGYEEGLCPIAESVSRRVIALPFHNGLSERDIDLVATALDVMVKRQDLGR